MPGGHPTTCTQEIADKAREYIQNYATYGDMIPSVVGMSCELKVNRTTLYKWAEAKHFEFDNILAECNTSQHRILVNGGLNSSMNSNITKLVLGKHGFHDKQEIDHSGISISVSNNDADTA